MAFDLSLEEFLERNRISAETWDVSGSNWKQLVSIAKDHEVELPRLRDAAELFARVVQKIPDVHSVRWRVKDTEHLLEKIVRKRALRVEKYLNISDDDYFKVVTDLVGLRALHLFKDDCFNVDAALRECWDLVEGPIAFVREGDHPDIVQQYQDRGFEVREHKDGYRSIHYVYASQPMQRRVLAEIQVRTIFEEGWSEIDHCVRYPNFSDSPLVGYFLAIFNRLAGSADEMGGFVKGLATTLDNLEQQVADANVEKERSFRAMEEALEQLEALRQKDAKSQASIDKLKGEIAQLRRAASTDAVVSGRSVVAGGIPKPLLGKSSLDALRGQVKAVETASAAFERVNLANIAGLRSLKTTAKSE